MKHISSHFSAASATNIQRNPISGLPVKRVRLTERGELMKFFMTRLNSSRATEGMPLLTMSRMGRVLQGIPTRDLYYLQSVCIQSKHFSKKFWWEIDPKKHQDVPFEDRAPKEWKKDWKKKDWGKKDQQK